MSSLFNLNLFKFIEKFDNNECSKTFDIKKGGLVISSSFGSNRQYSFSGSYSKVNELLSALPLPFYLYSDIPNASSSDHKNVVYKRLTPLNGLDLAQTLTTNWFSTGKVDNNVFNVDFKLFTSLPDAKADRNAWKFCNFNDPGVGFPRDCGPSGAVGGQWISTYRRNINTYPFSFYLYWDTNNDNAMDFCIPKYIETGDKRIKKISIECDDYANIYINGKLVKSISGAGTNFVINNPESDKSGNVFFADCTNTGGPGNLTATIELNNGSVIVTGDTWDVSPQPSGNFLNPTYKLDNSWFKPPYITNLPTPRKNQNIYAKPIWSDGKDGSGSKKCYARIIIGKLDIPKQCYTNLNDSQASCYLSDYPDLRLKLNNDIEEAKQHWKTYGCYEGRDYLCISPPQNIGKYDYQGCYNDTENRALPNYLGTASKPVDCLKLAEKNKYMFFGLQNGSECFSGNNEDDAKQYGLAQNCNIMGSPWTNQIYKRSQPFAPPIPVLNETNFENFENKQHKTLYRNFTFFIFLITILIILYFIINYKFKK